MESKSSCTDQKGRQSAERTLIIAEDDIPIENVTDFVIKNTRVEEEEEGFYIMDMERPFTLYKRWCELLPRIRPFYAIKCNPDPVLVRQLHMLGTGFDCASKSEIELALSIGCQPKDIIYAHTCKRPTYLRFAAKHGISMMTFDSKEELMKIADIYPSAEIVIRFAPRLSGSVYDVNNYKFGAPVEECENLLKLAKELRLNVIGVSFHVGSSCFNEMCFEDGINIARKIFDQAEKIGFTLSILDIGGGYLGKDTDYPFFLKICNVINRSLDEHFPASSGIKIIAEPGNYFACSPFALIANVFAVKEVERKLFKGVKDPPVQFKDDGCDKGYMYFVDDGVYQSFNELLLRPELDFEPIPIKTVMEVDELYPSCIWGQSCSGSDFINKRCQLPKLNVGDWVYFKEFGAYTIVLMTSFNGFTAPKQTYYYITMKTWQSIKWKSEDINANVLFINNKKEQDNVDVEYNGHVGDQT